MTQDLFSYPGGRVGFALLLMRASLVVLLISAANVIPISAPWLAVSTLMLSATLSMGFAVRITATLSAMTIAITAWPFDGTQGMPFLVCALNALALALMGPGSYSIDAIAFGRRTVQF